MSHSREPSLNTRVSQFRDGYDYHETLVSNEHYLRSRDPSPAVASRGRLSYFREHNDTALGTTLFNIDPKVHGDIDLSRPETHYDPYSSDTSAIIAPTPPTIHVDGTRGRSRERNNAHSDDELLLAQARKHADAHVDAYVLQRRQKEAASHRAPPPELSKSRGFYVTRWVLRVLSACVSIAIVAVLLDTLNTYKKTKEIKQAFKNGDGGGIMNVWPDLMKMHPTILMLSVAATAGVLSLLLSFTSINKRVRRMTKTGNIVTIFISFVCLALWIATTTYYASWDTKDTHWDLMSWSCKHSHPEASYNHVNYAEVCIEMRFAFWAAVSLAALEFINLLLFIIWFLKTRSGRGYAKLSEVPAIINEGTALYSF